MEPVKLLIEGFRIRTQYGWRQQRAVSIPASFESRLSLPVIAAPLFIISNPDLTIAPCKAGVVGSFPALNARPAAIAYIGLAYTATTCARQSSVPAWIRTTSLFPTLRP
jgi:hypothetical protein